MISPADITRKAANRYRDLQKHWLENGECDGFFPVKIPFRHTKASDDFSDTMAALRELRSHSKNETGSGYTIEWREKQSRSLGKNEFPEKITFDTEFDFLETVGKLQAFADFKTTVREILNAFPELKPWLSSNIQQTIDVSESGETFGLISVCHYLRDHPRCGLFARELPVAVDTKFVERNRKVLHQWLDIILPPETIRADENHFERRFGIGYNEPLIQFRINDPRLRFPFTDFALPLSEADKKLANINGKTTIYVVENKVNFLTFPTIQNSIVLAGLGGFVNLFRYLKWLHHCPEIYYWGDIDIQGFEILSQFRRWFPQVQSILMDEQTLAQFGNFAVKGKTTRTEAMLNLTAEEQALAEKCRAENLRLEQEKIPQGYVNGLLAE